MRARAGLLPKASTTRWRKASWPRGRSDASDRLAHFRLRPLLRRLLRMREIARRIDEREMREGLREIADEASRRRLVFLAHQADVVAQRYELFEQAHRLLAPAAHQISVGEPEAAGKKDALATLQAVLRLA